MSRGQGLPPDELPDRWLDAIPRGAALSSLTDWKRALETADRQASGRVSIEATSRLLEVLAKGPAAADEAATAFLRGRSLQIWQAATRSAPSDAIELSLRSVRLASETDAADAVAWCPAGELAAAPRPHVRLLGLTNRGWPRGSGEDPILPNHVLPADDFDADPAARADRRHFAVILGAATASAVLSRSRRGAQGSRVGRSPLLRNRAETILSRERIPEHAFNQSDRLLARPEEAAGIDQIGSAGRCWRDWHVERLTDHDGYFEPGHPAIKRSIERIQSATSLQRLLRDPLGFVWKYALGFDVPQQREQPLTIAPDELGKLVHELLRRAVDALEPEPGYAKASGRSTSIVLVALDLLYLNGRDLRRLPLLQRKAELKKIVGGTDIQFSESFEIDGREMFAHACKLGLEGVVSKVRDGPYPPGRSNDWVKKTCTQRETLTIAGFALDEGKWDGIYVGRRKGNDLIYAGKVDHGFDKASAADLQKKLKPLIRKTQPYTKRIAHKGIWVEPKLLAEIEYRAKSAEGKVRHPFFKGLREDL